MSSNVNNSGEGNEANAETNITHRTDSALPNPNEPTDSSSSGAVSENTHGTFTSGSNDNNNNSAPPFRPGVNPELQNLSHYRDVLQGLSTRVLEQRAALALRRTSAAVSTTAPSEATSFSSSSSPEISLEQRLERRIAQRRERSRQREQNMEQRREHSRLRRRRRRAHDSSSENEESAARRRRAHNVVESLRELMLVPTSSTLGESTEGGTPRSDADADTSINPASPSENQNQNGGGANDQGTESRNQDSRGENSNDDTNNVSNMDISNRPNVFRRGEGRNRGESTNNSNENNNNEENESDEDSINVVDSLITDGMGFELGSLIDRDRMLNNLMQRSIRMLRDVEGGGLAAQRSTDLKCPVCNEVFVDYEASDHPNAPGNRAGSIQCSHGALRLFTKLHQCPICFDENIEPPNVIALSCGHVVCKGDFCKLGGHVGTSRPQGCSKAKPVPGGTTRADSSSSRNDFLSFF